MTKKIILGLVAVVVVAGGVAAMSAYEAHVINVTAKIENALTVPTEAVEFGTVFPQEYLERSFTLSLSNSFMDETQLRRGDVYYQIVQKPKCECDYWGTVDEKTYCIEGQYAPVDYATHLCPTDYSVMPDLCQFLSKIPEDEMNDIGVPSYYNIITDECSTPSPDLAQGYLVKCHPAHVACTPGDIIDCWTVDLKVPPVEGHVGQDWPASCSGWTVPTDGAVYGCDLWIEVVSLSDLEEPPVDPYCGDGWITGDENCGEIGGPVCGTGEVCNDCICVPQ